MRTRTADRKGGKSNIKAEKKSRHMRHCKNLTVRLLTRMAFYVATVRNSAAKTLNKISPEQNYLWDFRHF